MNLQAPKYLQWKPQLVPAYTSNYDLLITSGCSFTASTQQLDSAASWPGFLKDRLGLELCVDMSFPGVGNQYIKDSVLHAIMNVNKNSKPLVVIMWSGLDRTEQIVDNNVDAEPMAKVGSYYYKRVPNDFSPRELASQNLLYMMEVAQFLDNHNVDYVFTTYINMTKPSLIPVRDTTPPFYKNLNITQEQAFEKLPFVIAGDNCLYEWTFLNDYESSDGFHPPVEANLKWTDDVLLKELCARGLIDEIHN
jgi:hypothetical protein